MSHLQDEKKYEDVETSQTVGTVDEMKYAGEPVEAHTTLKRGLKGRHLAMISIGGVIGTGLFLGTGTALANGGPLGLFLGFAFMGSICYAVMVSLGEMVAYLPVSGGHITLAARFVDPALAFTMGYNYFYNWAILLPTELVASAVLITYWNQSISNGVWITVCLVVVTVINFLGVRAFGEAEFWFASIKVLTITGLIILSIILTSGGGPNHETIGFRFWRDPGPLHQYGGFTGSLGRFLGFFSVLTQAAFSFIGTEIVAIAAGEAKNPRRNIPRAIKRVYVRILLFYLGGTFVIGLVVPSTDKSLRISSGIAKSPFVIAIRNAGIPALPSIINACILTSAWSAASSDLFTSSRALYGLALTSHAPKVFARTTKSGLPYVALTFCTCFGFLGYMTLSEQAGKVFGWLVNLTAAAGLITWWGISLTYLRFRKGLFAQGYNRRALPYWSFANTYGFAAWYAIIAISVILFFFGYEVFLSGQWDTATFITNYLPVFLFPLLYVGWKVYKKTSIVRPEDMDFTSGLEEIEADSYEEPPPRNFVEKVWQAVM